MISTTANHVIIDKASYAALRTKATQNARVARELREQLRETNALLATALNHLAAERGAKDRQHFSRRWIQNHAGGV